MKFKLLALVVGICCVLSALPLTAQTTQAPAQANAAAAALPPPPGPPTVTGPSKIGIIDIQQAIASTQEGKKLDAGVQASFAPKRAELDNEAKAIQAIQNQINAGGNTMSAEAKSQLNQELQSKQRDYQQAADNAQSDYQNAETNVMNTIGAKMMPMIKKYAEDHGYTAIVDVSMPWPQSPVLYYNPGTVITGDIIREYDAANPVGATAAKPGGGH